MHKQSLVVISVITVIAGGLLAQPVASLPQKPHVGGGGYIEITPDKLCWFSVLGIPKAQFAYLKASCT